MNDSGGEFNKKLYVFQEGEGEGSGKAYWKYLTSLNHSPSLAGKKGDWNSLNSGCILLFHHSLSAGHLSN
jgi:hypothetical protein